MGAQPSATERIALEDKEWKWFHAAIGWWLTSGGASILDQAFSTEHWWNKTWDLLPSPGSAGASLNCYNHAHSFPGCICKGASSFYVLHPLQFATLSFWCLFLVSTLSLQIFLWHLQRAGQEWTRPAFLDSVLAFGLVLHGLQSNTTDANISLIRVPQFVGSPEPHAGLSFIYLLAGMYCYLVGLALAPYRAFYALFIIGVITAITRIRDKQAKGKGENGVNQRHFHRHWNKSVLSGTSILSLSLSDWEMSSLFVDASKFI